MTLTHRYPDTEAAWHERDRDDVRQWDTSSVWRGVWNPGEVSSITIYVRYGEYPRAEVDCWSMARS